jgi:hypothetical protein
VIKAGLFASKSAGVIQEVSLKHSKVIIQEVALKYSDVDCSSKPVC